MKKLSLLVGAAMFPAAATFATSYQPASLQNVFYQAAWKEYAEGIEADLQDPSLMNSKEDDFRILMYKAIGQNQKSFRHEYFHITQDNSDCLNTQLTAYEGQFSIGHPAQNIVAVSLQTTNIYVESLQNEGCAPAL